MLKISFLGVAVATVGLMAFALMDGVLSYADAVDIGCVLALLVIIRIYLRRRASVRVQS